MLTKERLERLNFLARKSKIEALSQEELEEQKELRQEYIIKFKAQFKGHLDSIRFVEDEDKQEKKVN